MSDPREKAWVEVDDAEYKTLKEYFRDYSHRVNDREYYVLATRMDGVTAKEKIAEVLELAKIVIEQQRITDEKAVRAIEKRKKAAEKKKKEKEALKAKTDREKLDVLAAKLGLKIGD